jgi:protein-tyrosine phosphatase
VDWLDAELFGDELPGRLGLTFLPGKRGASLRYPGRVYRRELQRDLAELRRVGVSRLVLLVTDEELDRWGDHDVVEQAAALDIEVERFPMADGGTPASPAVMDEIVERIRSARARGRSVAVACMGGVGRTGTVAACALVFAGADATSAVDRVRRVRHPEAVETPRQLRFVADYAEHRRMQSMR